MSAFRQADFSLEIKKLILVFVPPAAMRRLVFLRAVGHTGSVTWLHFGSMDVTLSRLIPKRVLFGHLNSERFADDGLSGRSTATQDRVPGYRGSTIMRVRFILRVRDSSGAGAPESA